MKNGLICASMAMMLIVSEGPILGQASASEITRNYGWIDGGVGYISSRNFSAPSVAFSFSHLSALGLLTMQYVGGNDRDRAYPAIYDATNPPYLGELGVLYGRAFRNDHLFAAASVGISVTWGNSDDPSPGDHFRTVGIPLELEGFVRLFPVIGLGCKVFTNLNDGSSFYTGLLCVRIGILRYVQPEARNDIHQ